MATLLQRAMEMRNAIDAHESAMMGLSDFVDLRDLFRGASDDLILAPKMRLGHVRRVINTLDELTRIVNSDDYTPTQLAMFTPEQQRGPGHAGLIRWIIKQLPDDKVDGLRVLDDARAMVERFKR